MIILSTFFNINNTFYTSQITTEGSDGEEMSTADLEGLPEAVTGATGPLTIRMVMQGKVS